MGGCCLFHLTSNNFASNLRLRTSGVGGCEVHPLRLDKANRAQKGDARHITLSKYFYRPPSENMLNLKFDSLPVAFTPDTLFRVHSITVLPSFSRG